jgi:hypothetical protein
MKNEKIVSRKGLQRGGYLGILVIVKKTPYIPPDRFEPVQRSPGEFLKIF